MISVCWGIMRLRSKTTISPRAADLLAMNPPELSAFCMSALETHSSTLAKGGPSVLKDAPESAVTLVRLPGRPAVCVKEFRWRGMLHALKGLFRPTQGLRTFRNGVRLRDAGIGAAAPLALVREKILGVVKREWVVMEEVPDCLELDRYILKRKANQWTGEEKTAFVRRLARFIGAMHSGGVFHSDLKTCNILVSDGRSEHDPSESQSPDRPSGFHLVDYDDVTFGTRVRPGKRIKNLVQIFLSTPSEIGGSDRARFLREYCLHTGMSAKERRDTARRVTAAARGRDILYVGFDGDVVEKWEKQGP